jgi:hypothetical protein
MEIINNAIQTVAPDQNVIFTDTVVKGNCSIVHREGSGLVTLRGITDQCRARYKVSFGGNVAIPPGGTVAPISVALSINGEAVASSTMISTPAATEQFNNIFGAIFLDVPRGCCYQVGVKNLTDSAIEVQNANLIVERVA